MDNKLPDNKDYINRREVRSTTSNKVYIISQRRSNGEWCCSCWSWRRQRNCKHLSNQEASRPVDRIAEMRSLEQLSSRLMNGEDNPRDKLLEQELLLYKKGEIEYKHLSAAVRRRCV